MIIQKIVSYPTIARLYFKSVRLFCFNERNFESFRNKAEYRKLIVHPILDQNKSRTSGLPCATKDSDGFFNHLLQRENVMKLSPLQVKEILSVLANSKFDLVKYASILKYLDEKCALSAERLPLDLSFYILDAWFIILGPKTFRKHYYSAIVSQWSRKIKKCSKSHLILVLYFIGKSKSPQPFLMDSVLDHMENILSEFSNEEIAVACLSFFKCSKRVNSAPFLKQSCQAAEDLLQVNDQFNAISILKCLRLSKYYDAQLYEHVENYVMQNYSTFNLVVCTHFLALFATQNIYSKELFEILEAQAITSLVEEVSEGSIRAHPSTRSRVKDLARLLWALTTIGHPVKEHTLTSVTSCIEKRFKLGEYESQLPILIDTLQSFVLVNHYPAHIFSPVLCPSTFKKIYNIDKAKPKYQLYFVSRSVAIEHPEISTNMSNINYPIPKHLEKEIKERKGFQEILAFLNLNFPLCIKRCCYVMPHIMIAGIFISHHTSDFTGVNRNLVFNSVVSKQVINNCGECICIEILDPSVYVGKHNQIIGLMQTKIRQLKKLDFKVIALSTDEILKIEQTGVPQNRNIENFFQEYLV